MKDYKSILCEKMAAKSNNHNFLYHYTSYDSLKSILANNSFKFNRTDQINDLIEEKRIVNDLGENYVSCFTHNNNESIPMWILYAKENGLRIGFKNDDIFNQTKIYYFANNEKIYFEKSIISSDKVLKNIIKTKDGYIEANNPLRIDVIYSTKKQKIEFTIENEYAFGVYPSLQVGLKGEAWEYEKETRYYIGTNFWNRYNIQSLYCEIENNFYNDLEIVWNPIMLNKEIKKDEIKAIVGDAIFNKIIFKDSELSGKVSLGFLKRKDF